MPADKLIVGNPEIYPCDSPDGLHSAFFEDDGETGYFYALDISRAADGVLDAVHIYNVVNIIDRDKPSVVEIIWSKDGSKCALLINEYPHALFDFLARRGYCRTNYPNSENPKDRRWITADHSWSDEAASWLRER